MRLLIGLPSPATVRTAAARVCTVLAGAPRPARLAVAGGQWRRGARLSARRAARAPAEPAESAAREGGRGVFWLLALQARRFKRSAVDLNAFPGLSGACESGELR